MVCSMRKVTRYSGWIFSSATLFAVILSVTVGCSGGGGGGGGSSADGTLKRSTKTGLRILHGALDLPPVTVRIPEQLLFTAGYAEGNFYHSAPEGAVTINLDFQVPGGITTRAISPTLVKDTEYSVFVFGSYAANNLNTLLIEDAVLRPETGFARFRLFNAYQGGGALSATIGGVAIPATSYGSASGFIDLASGAQSLVVKDGSGRTVSSLALTLDDRGETTIMITGNKELGVVFAPEYKDLD